MDIKRDWLQIKGIFSKAFKTSWHYAIATTDANGMPHVTPIGSIILTTPGKGFYFEKFPSQLSHNLRTNRRVCVMAVNSGRGFWLKSLVYGKFSELPGVRLIGEAGNKREASKEEIERWQRRIKVTRFSKGHDLLWKDMQLVRDIVFTEAYPVKLGDMTKELLT